MKPYIFGAFLFLVVILGSCISRSYSAINMAEAQNVRAAQSVYVQEQAQHANIRIERNEALTTVSIIGLSIFIGLGSLLSFIFVANSAQKTYKAKNTPVITVLDNGMYLALVDGQQMIGDSWASTLLPINQAREVNKKRIEVIRDTGIAKELAASLSKDGNSEWIGQALINQLESSNT